MQELAALSTHVGRTLGGRYRLDAVLGVGGLGAVFEAVDTIDDHAVAVKLLLPSLAPDEEFRQRFLRQARTAMAVRHPSLAAILEVGEQDGVPFLVEELLHGEDLGTYLARLAAPMTTELALALIIPVLRAVGAAHLSGLSHRDLRPDNIVLAITSGVLVPKVKELGIDRLVADDPLRSTGGGTIVGSPVYMSPEHVMAPRAVDARSDVWSAGIVLYEMLAGFPPFAGADANALFVQICRDEPTPLSRVATDLDLELSEIVMSCLRREPRERPKDALKVAEELESFLERHVGTTPRVKPIRAKATGPGGAVVRVEGFDPVLLEPDLARRANAHVVQAPGPDPGGLADYGQWKMPKELSLAVQVKPPAPLGGTMAKPEPRPRVSRPSHAGRASRASGELTLDHDRRSAATLPERRESRVIVPSKPDEDWTGWLMTAAIFLGVLAVAPLTAGGLLGTPAEPLVGRALGLSGLLLLVGLGTLYQAKSTVAPGLALGGLGVLVTTVGTFLMSSPKWEVDPERALALASGALGVIHAGGAVAGAGFALHAVLEANRCREDGRTALGSALLLLALVGVAAALQLARNASLAVLG